MTKSLFRLSAPRLTAALALALAGAVGCGTDPSPEPIDGGTGRSPDAGGSSERDSGGPGAPQGPDAGGFPAIDASSPDDDAAVGEPLDGGESEPDAGPTEDPVWACDDCPPPPATLNDWISGHGGEELTLLDYDGHVAVYTSANVDRSLTDWVLPFVSQAVQYMKRNYDAECHYGPDRLYVFLHQGSNFAGRISSYFDEPSSFRNAIDALAPSWERKLENINIDVMSHELAHIVEGSSNCIHESPGFGVWGDSKWAEIFQYDLYKGLGMEDDAQKLHQRFMSGGDTWYPKFYYPLYENYGGVRVLDRFFKLLAEHFPTRPENDGRNPIYTRRATLGELVHFYSGAANADVSHLAEDAFANFDRAEFEQAQRDFPGVTY